MTRKRIGLAVSLASTVFSMALSGCAERSANSRFYLLQTPREAAATPTEDGKAILAVPRFSIDAPYSGRGLVYRLDEYRYESDAYNEFLISPAVMITDKTRDWLADSGLFSQVLSSGSGADATHRMEANITALYGDFRDKDTPKAVVEIRFFLLRLARRGGPEIVFAKPYAAVVEIGTSDPEGVIAGFDRCLRTILTELEKDLAGMV